MRRVEAEQGNGRGTVSRRAAKGKNAGRAAPVWERPVRAPPGGGGYFTMLSTVPVVTGWYSGRAFA